MAAAPIVSASHRSASLLRCLRRLKHLSRRTPSGVTRVLYLNSSMELTVNHFHKGRLCANTHLLTSSISKPPTDSMRNLRTLPRVARLSRACPHRLHSSHRAHSISKRLVSSVKPRNRTLLRFLHLIRQLTLSFLSVAPLANTANKDSSILTPIPLG